MCSLFSEVYYYRSKYFRRENMRYLSGNAFDRAVNFIRGNARPLEKNYLEYRFFNDDEKNVLDELEKFQNDDGGFGNSIEPDFRMPYSSPMSTSLGVRHLKEFDKTTRAQKMIKASIRYFENSFNDERNGWYVLDRKVNDYPHAPWWHFDEKTGMIVID
jgi:hypothetical protein